MDAQPRMVDLAAVKERQRRACASGDYAALGAPLLVMGELLCEVVNLHPGWRVLDVATGSGNTALAVARRSCDVTGVDYVPALLERGRERAATERLEALSWRATSRACPSRTPPSTRCSTASG